MEAPASRCWSARAGGVLIALVSVLAAAVAASTAASELAAGLILGSPTGVTVKSWAQDGSTALALSAGAGPGARLAADHLWRLGGPRTSDLELAIQLGVGVTGAVLEGCSPAWFHALCDRRFAGIRVPVVTELRLLHTPFDIGLEVAPLVAVTDRGPSGGVDLALTLRALL